MTIFLFIINAIKLIFLLGHMLGILVVWNLKKLILGYEDQVGEGGWNDIVLVLCFFIICKYKYYKDKIQNIFV